MGKTAELKKLEAEIAKDTSLPLQESNLVFGEGNADGEVMFIGEAPGATEDRLKRPFVGCGGELLDQLISEIGWKREEVYISNVVKRRPPKNRDPLSSEIKAYMPYLNRQIAIINPRVVATLGRFAMNYFLPEAKITRDHGRVFQIDGRLVFPIYHPGAALRSTEKMNAFCEDMKKLPKVLAGEFAIGTPKTVANSPGAKAKPKRS